MYKLGNKTALLEYFLARILKNYYHVLNQHLWIRLTAKLCEETEILKFVIAKYHERMKCLSFGQNGPYLGILGLEFGKLFSYLK